MFERFRPHRRFQYSRWDGTQHLDDLDAEDVLDALSEDYLRHGDLRRALDRLTQQGFMGRDGQRRMGMQEMLEHLRQRYRERLERYNLSGVMDDVKEKLEHIKQLEREGIQHRLDGADQQGSPGQQGQQGQQSPQGQQSGMRGQAGQSGAQPDPQGQSGQTGAGDSGDLDPETKRRMLERIAQRKLDYLDQLPPDPAGQIQKLSDYDFMDEQAREEFQELLAMLQQQIMQQYFSGMQQALQNMTPEDLARMREMVRELNQMLRERAEGNEPDFDSFMQKYGDFFPGVNSLDDLIEQMQRQQAAMQALMDSMSPSQREQLHDMIDQLIGDDRLRVDLAELAMNLQALGGPDLRTKFRVTGDEPVSLAEAMGLMSTLQEMDELEGQIQRARRSGDISDLDAQQMDRLVGEEEAQALQQLQQMLKQLEEEGLVHRHGDRYELTSRGIRRIGQKALEDIFAKLKRDAFGGHRLQERGTGGERDEETKLYAFGDAFHLNLEKTLMNSVHRNGAGTPARLTKDDFEVFRTEQMTSTATVLMLDMSYSMLQNDLWHPAKKVAIALDSLIRGQFPRDQLFLVGFSNIAHQYAPEELLELGEWDYIQGTNMMHGLMLARELLNRTRAANKQIIMITDGGPTVWREGKSWQFFWPPPPMAILQTLREARRCARDHITINVFMLWDDPELKHFVNQMATVNRGRAFYTSPDDLGEYIMIDYLGNKRKRVS